MFSAKLVNTDNRIFDTFRRSDDKHLSFAKRGLGDRRAFLSSCFGTLLSTLTCAAYLFYSLIAMLSSLLRLAHLALAFFAHLFTKIYAPHLFDSLRGELLSKALCITNLCGAHLGACLSTTLRASMRLCHILSSFFTYLSAKCFDANLLFCFRRELPAQSRAGNGSHIESLIAKWLQCIQPMLLTSSQHFRDKYQLQDFEDKGIRAVLIPGTLHVLIIVLIALKF